MRHRRRGRPPKECIIRYPYTYIRLRAGRGEEVVLSPRELEAMRLVDYEGMTQEDAAGLMGVSRATVARLLESGRKKVVDAVIHGKDIVVHAG